MWIIKIMSGLFALSCVHIYIFQLIKNSVLCGTKKSLVFCSAEVLQRALISIELQYVTTEGRKSPTDPEVYDL